MSPFGRFLPLLFVLAITGIALVERFSQVIAPRLEIPEAVMVFLLLLVYAGYLLILRRLVEILWSQLHRVNVDSLFFVLWVLLGIAFFWLYPLADSGSFGFFSDREEGLDISVRALLNGDYPYLCRAQSGVHIGCPSEGTSIAAMPGAFLLSAPVILLFGGAGWLSLLSLGMAYWGFKTYFGDDKKALVYLLSLLAGAPIMLAEVLTGGDHLANLLWVCVPLVLLLKDPGRKAAPWLSLLLGIAMSWRGVFWLLVFPVLAHFIAQRRWREMVKPVIYAVLGFALVTLPLVLWQPEHFTPWQVQQRFSLYEHMLPHASFLIPLATIVSGTLLGWFAPNREALLIACGWVLLLPVLAGATFNSIQLGRPTLLFYGWYGIFAIVFWSLPTFSSRWPATENTRS